MLEVGIPIGIKKPTIIAVDNGGTNTRVTTYGGENITDIHEYRTPASYEKAMQQLARTTRMILGGKRPDAVGFSLAGSVKDGRIVSAGKLQEYGWANEPFAKDVASSLNISQERIILLNDCVAGANAERVMRQPEEGKVGVFMALSTGFGAALYTRRELMPDEPGHYYLKEGAICGDGEEGHIEAHIGGAGIAKKFEKAAENIPHDDERWREIKGDFVESVKLTLERYESKYGMPSIIGFTGSVALGGPQLLSALSQDLNLRLEDRAPRVAEAWYQTESGLYGASFAARDHLAS